MILAENNVGLIVRVITMLHRRRIYISQLDVSEIENKGLYIIKIALLETSEEIRKLVLQINKQVEVYKTFCVGENDNPDVQVENYLRKMQNEFNTTEILQSEAI